VLGFVLGKLSLGEATLRREGDKKLNSREIGCERWRCKEMSQDHVQYRASPLLALSSVSATRGYGSQFHFSTLRVDFSERSC
jgi:hypothetical protein